MAYKRARELLRAKSVKPAGLRNGRMGGPALWSEASLMCEEKPMARISQGG